MERSGTARQLKIHIIGTLTKKIYRLKEDQAFGFRWNWDEEKKLCGIRLQISSLLQPVPHLFLTDNDAPSVLGGGGGVRILWTILLQLYQENN